jgi:hypothetical protein
MEISELIFTESYLYFVLLSLPMGMEWVQMKAVSSDIERYIERYHAITYYTLPHLTSPNSQGQIKLFSEIMQYCTEQDSEAQCEPSKPSETSEISEPSDPIQVVLCIDGTIKPVKMCRGALASYYVFKKYADPAMGFPPTHVTWNHWTSVRSALMSDKYNKEGVMTGIHRGLRMLVFPKELNLPNLAVSESECYRIMC